MYLFSPVWHLYGTPGPLYVILTCYKIIILDFFHHLISFKPVFILCIICTTITSVVITFQLKSAYICTCNMWTQRTSHCPELDFIYWFTSFTMNTDLVFIETFRYQGKSKLHGFSAMPRIHQNWTECAKMQFVNIATNNIHVYVQPPVA